jgi:hypothetical protein
MQADRFSDLIADGEHRIQRGHRFLENHRNLRAADIAERRCGRGYEIDRFAAGSGEVEAPADNSSAAVLDKAHDGERRHRLAGARFADDRDGSRHGRCRERDCETAVTDAIRGRELDSQFLNPKDGCCGSGQRGAPFAGASRIIGDMR